MADPFDPVREDAFAGWLMNVPVPGGQQGEDIAHEAFCAGWEAERERIRHALLDCRSCGKIHVPLALTRPLEAWNWASPDDGHPYAPAWVAMRGDLGDIIRQVLEAPRG